MTDEERRELRQLIERSVRSAMAEGPKDEVRLIPPLDGGQQLGLAVLLRDPTVLTQALADYLLDRGFDYAAAVAEKAAKDERERIAERLYSESAHILSRGPDP